MWTLLFSPAVFILPGIGLLALAGPIVVALVSALEGVVVVGSISALGAAMMQIGIPKESDSKRETNPRLGILLSPMVASAAMAASSICVLLRLRSLNV